MQRRWGKDEKDIENPSIIAIFWENQYMLWRIKNGEKVAGGGNEHARQRIRFSSFLSRFSSILAFWLISKVGMECAKH